MSDNTVEQTLYICSDIHIYRIPPRPSSGGYRSGDWKVADEIFKGRLRLVSLGKDAEIRFEDMSNSELFALVPIELGKRHLVVEPVVDSSRYFVVRVEDPETNAHAFLGLGFETREVAFDFSAALEDNERRTLRESSQGSTSELSPEIAALHKPVADYGLKEGQTIQVKIKNKVSAGKKTKTVAQTPPRILAPPTAGGKSKSEPPSSNNESTNWATFD